MASSREDRRTAAREGVLAAAHRQLAEAGCGSASVAAVAARAGIATGSLYRHFPSRGELLATVVGDALRGEHALLSAAIDGRPSRDGLVAWIRLSAKRAGAAPVLTFALLAEPAGPAVDAARIRAGEAQEATLAALLAEGARTHAWPSGDAALQAKAITGALRATLVGPTGAPAGRVSPDALVTFVLGAVGAR